MPKADIIKECEKNLLVSKELIEKNLYDMAATQKIVLEKVNGEEAGFLCTEVCRGSFVRDTFCGRGQKS